MAVCSIIVAIVFAILGALGRLSSNPVLYAVATLYVSLVRGTPLIVQILFIYLALPADLGWASPTSRRWPSGSSPWPSTTAPT